ncbi:MAG TPA: tyrosine-type recombinase/integrase [Acetobacteraceae bacterium]|nr:tyrosine-type recombinase/integrase [Acetobacteraceae bacterium]
MAADLSLALRNRGAEALPPELAHLADGAFGAALDRAIEYAHRALSPTTEKIYADDWSAFRAWCHGHGAPALPAPPAVVAAYLAERAATLGRSGLRLILAAIGHYHRRAGQPWSAVDPVIRAVMHGILRAQRRPVRPAAALTSVEIRRLLAVCDDAAPGAVGLSASRDRALLLVGFAGALRRGELVALDREDLRFTKDGLVLRIRRSKRDQEGEGAEVGIVRGRHPATCPVRALEAWLRRGRIAYGPVFRRLTAAGTVEDRLTGNGVWKILRRRAAQAGLTVDDGERLSPHGLRAGCITEAYLQGALDEQAAAHARQSSLATTRAYRRRAKVVAASPSRLLDL